jgi:predicted ATPase
MWPGHTALQADTMLPQLQWAGWLFQGKEAGVKEAWEVGKVTMDHRLRKAEHSHQCVSTGAGGSLDMRIGPAAWARS